jgi:tetratricopeptide (TPR) repeat protein
MLVTGDAEPAHTLAIPDPGKDPKPEDLFSHLGPMQLTGVHHLTQAGTVMGTFGYMPPEQLLGRPVDARTDIFAVGAVLYEMIQGAPAFPGDTLQEKIAAVLHSDPAPLKRKGVPDGLDRVVRRALAKEPSQRYQSASELLTDLRDIQGKKARSGAPMTLAILDVEGVEPGDERAWIVSALTEALGKSFSRIPNIFLVPGPKVAATLASIQNPESAIEFEVGMRLGCNLVLSGSIALEEDRFSARINLTDVMTGYRILNEELAGHENETSALASRLAVSSAEILDLGLPSGAGASTTSEAHKFYLQARRLETVADRSTMLRAHELFKQSVDADPRFVPALARLACVTAMSYNFTSDPKSLETAIAYADRAIEIDPDCAEAWLWKGYSLGNSGDWGVKPFECFVNAMRLDPWNWMNPYFASGCMWVNTSGVIVELAARSGVTITPEEAYEWRYAEGERLLQRSLEMNPRFAWTWLSLGINHQYRRKLTESQWCMEKAIEYEPTAVPKMTGCQGYLGEFHRVNGNLDEARKRLMAALEELEQTDQMYRDSMRGVFLCSLGRTALDSDDPDAARTAFTQAVQHIQGRSGAKGSGQIMILALAGLARSGAGAESYEEAKQLFEDRSRFNFSPTVGCMEDVILVELGKAALALDRTEEGRGFLDRARELGTYEPLEETEETTS